MLKHWIFLCIVALSACAAAAGCSAPVETQLDQALEQQPGENSVDYDESGDAVCLTIYFRNDKYRPGDPDSESLVPVPRWMDETDGIIRAASKALFRGPLAHEGEQYGAAPLADREIIVEDSYVQGNICIIKIEYEEPLFENFVLGQDRAEDIFIHSVVGTLTGFEAVDSVWLFRQGSPWQGDTRCWCSPTPLPGRTVAYNLYFRVKTEVELKEPAWDMILEQVEVDLDSGVFAGECPFSKIIELLAADYDDDRSAVLPEDNRALGFDLQDGVLTIDLTGSPTQGHKAAQVMRRSLVYTFTELPEIDRVKVTLEGEPWSDGHLVWDAPLGRRDLS